MQWELFEEGSIKGVSRTCADSEHEFVMYQDDKQDGKYILFMREIKNTNTDSYKLSEPSDTPEEAYDTLWVGSPNSLCEFFDNFFNAGHEEDKADMLKALESATKAA